MARLGYTIGAVLWLIAGAVGWIAIRDPYTPAVSREWYLVVLVTGSIVLLLGALSSALRLRRRGMAVTAIGSAALTGASALVTHQYHCCAISYHSVRGWPSAWLHTAWNPGPPDDRATYIEFGGLVTDFVCWAALIGVLVLIVQLAKCRSSIRGKDYRQDAGA